MPSLDATPRGALGEDTKGNEKENVGKDSKEGRSSGGGETSGAHTANGAICAQTPPNPSRAAGHFRLEKVGQQSGRKGTIWTPECASRASILGLCHSQ